VHVVTEDIDGGMVIDFEKERIIVVNSRDRHYNWKKIVLKKLKQK